MIKPENEPVWEDLGEWEIASTPGNERSGVFQVAERLKLLDIPGRTLEQLKTAVAETIMNAMEHGNHYSENKPVLVRLKACENAVMVSVSDQGGGVLSSNTTAPDLEAKLAGLQSPRGWGLFLVEKMVDELRDSHDEQSGIHTVDLIVRW